MKRLVSILAIILMIAAFSTAAAADETAGALNTSVLAKSGNIDYDFSFIPNGFAGGIGAVGDIAKAGTSGLIYNGDVKGFSNVTAGGATLTTAMPYFPNIGDLSIGVKSETTNVTITSAELKVRVDPDLGGAGIVGGEFFGITGQASLNASVLGDSPFFFKTDGYTGGVAGQGSIGLIGGEVKAMSGSDYYEPVLKDSKAGARAGGSVEQQGFSYSQSYRFVDFNGGNRTEGMGTFVGAGTTIDSSSYAYDWDKGHSCANADVYGGWVAAGEAATKTVQVSPDGSIAKASAVGVYAGAGSLDTNFNGSAIGYSQTQITKIGNMKGSIVSASSGMQVSAKTSN